MKRTALTAKIFKEECDHQPFSTTTTRHFINLNTCVTQKHRIRREQWADGGGKQWFNVFVKVFNNQVNGRNKEVNNLSFNRKRLPQVINMSDIKTIYRLLNLKKL